MKRMLPGMSLVAAMLFVASSALAGGVNLAWNNCASEGGVANRTSTCLSNSGTNAVVGSFVPGTDQAACTGIEIVVDIIVGDGVSTIPAWWDMTPGTGCRAGSVVMNGTVNPANSVCNDWAGGAGAGGLAAYSGAYPAGGAIDPANLPAHRRIIGGIAVALANAADITTGSEYFAFNCLINNAKTVGTGSCAGCSTAACIVLNSINVATNDINIHEFLSGGAAGAGSDMATWQGAGPSCALVPTKNATWGQVKALYH
jgi:hypothetical protein